MSKEKKKGSLFEVQVLNYLTENGFMAFRNPPKGKNDEGDITMYSRVGKIILECKNRRKMELSEWVDEAEAEKGNADALIGCVVHKRKGCGDAKMGKTYVTVTLDDLMELVRR